MSHPDPTPDPDPKPYPNPDSNSNPNSHSNPNQVRDGDIITLDPKARSLTVDVSDAELAMRRAAWLPRPQKPNTKGVLNNYARHVHCIYALERVCMYIIRNHCIPNHSAPGSWRQPMSARPPHERGRGGRCHPPVVVRAEAPPPAP